MSTGATDGGPDDIQEFVNAFSFHQIHISNFIEILNKVANHQDDIVSIHNLYIELSD